MKKILFSLFILLFLGLISYIGYINEQIGAEEVLAICFMSLFFLSLGCFTKEKKIILTEEGIDFYIGRQIKKSIKYKQITKIEIFMSPIIVEIYEEEGIFCAKGFKQLSNLYVWLADLLLRDYDLHKRIRNFSFDDSIGIRVKAEMEKRKADKI